MRQWLTIILLFCAVSLFAQRAVDLKLNLGSAFTLGANVQADVELTPQSSVSIGAAYAESQTIFSWTVNNTYKRARLIGEYRYYTNPKHGADGVFVGGYTKLGSLRIKQRGTALSGSSSLVETAEQGSLRLAAGALAGCKFAYKSGFLWELNVGLGFGQLLSSDPLLKDLKNIYTNGVEGRIGILVGYRL